MTQLHGEELGITSNVYIRVINGKNGDYKDIIGHNKATKSLLLGMYKLLRGDFKEDNTSFDYAPQWLKVGESSTTPTFTDTRLWLPLYEDGTQANNYDDGTIEYKTRQRGKEYTEGTNSITFSVKFYMESNDLPGTVSTPTTITEVGLFSDANILLARYVLDEPIEKYDTDFVDILWEVTITSL